MYATDAEYEKIDTQVIQVLSKQPPIGVMQMYKIPLKYANAVEVAKILQDFFDKKSGAAQTRSVPWWARDNASQQMENQVAISAEPTSNTLIVFCTETTKTMIDDLLDLLRRDGELFGSGGARELLKKIEDDRAGSLSRGQRN